MHGECARAHLESLLSKAKAKGLCQLVSSNDPQSCTLAPTRDRVERSLARRNRIKSGIAMRFEMPATPSPPLPASPTVFEETVEKRAPPVNICMNDPTVEANFLNKRAIASRPGAEDIIRLIPEETLRRAKERRRRRSGREEKMEETAGEKV